MHTSNSVYDALWKYGDTMLQYYERSSKGFRTFKCYYLTLIISIYIFIYLFSYILIFF